MEFLKKRKLIFKIAIVIIIIVLAFSAGFRFAIRFNLSQSKNPYCLEKIYYISVMMDKMDDDSYSEQLNKILKSAGYYFRRGKMTAIDEAAYICLLALINENGSRISKKLDIFLERHTDFETGLLFEYSHDDLIDSKVDFTAEIISLFENENIGIDASDEFYEKIISFLNEENIQDFIAADYSLEWIYFFFFDYAGELDEDSASQLISIEKEYLDYYFEILKG